MDLVFIIVYIVWGFSEIMINRLMRSKNTDQQNADRNSLSLIWLTIIVSIGIAIYISMAYFLPVANSAAIPFIGLGSILLGLVLRLFIINSLGKFFTADVTIRQEHKLKTDGFYKFLRHPSYFASLLSFIGFGLSLNNWLSLLIIFIAILTAFINRIKVEEKILTEHFGKEYIDYKKTTNGLIPFIC